ncbi:MAG: DoxX family protein [Flavobacteriaceae bacterium]
MNIRLENFRLKIKKAHPVLLWLMMAWLAQSLIKNGIRKFDTDGIWTGAFEEWGFPVWFRIFIGILETAGGILLLVPRFMFRFIGGMILCLVMSGALITRTVYGVGYDDFIFILFAAISFLFFATYKR